MVEVQNSSLTDKEVEYICKTIFCISSYSNERALKIFDLPCVCVSLSLSVFVSVSHCLYISFCMSVCLSVSLCWSL